MVARRLLVLAVLAVGCADESESMRGDLLATRNELQALRTRVDHLTAEVSALRADSPGTQRMVPWFLDPSLGQEWRFRMARDFLGGSEGGLTGYVVMWRRDGRCRANVELAPRTGSPRPGGSGLRSVQAAFRRADNLQCPSVALGWSAPPHQGGGGSSGQFAGVQFFECTIAFDELCDDFPTTVTVGLPRR